MFLFWRLGCYSFGGAIHTSMRFGFWFADAYSFLCLRVSIALVVMRWCTSAGSRPACVPFLSKAAPTHPFVCCAGRSVLLLLPGVSLCC